MILDTVQTIWKGIEGIARTFLTLDNIFYIGVGFTLLMVLFFFIKSAQSYECKLERSVNKLNEWLFKHQTLTENNLLEFNMLIKSKKTPKILRKHWQQYMLYRDKLPSEYMSSYNCIDKPAKTSSFTANIKSFINIYIATAIVTLLLSLITFSGKSESILTYLSISFITPVLIIVLGVIFTLILRAMQNYNLASLYQTFHIFNRYIDKASVTIPKYVDFEILFTKKEIKNGIPILGEYLEKRARQEQEELEEAQRNAVAHEEYDFSQSGVDGSLVLERAMKESETFINFKQRTLQEIQQFESEISTLKKNYENTSKDYQRKLQASKENMERLRQQQEESTNRIEVNYIRKQQQDEVKKQEQLEKDQEDATNKFNVEINSLSEEIDKRRVDLENKKQKVQEAMENEYQTFSTKLHKNISTEIEKISNEAIGKISIEKDQYAQAIQYLKNEVDNKDAILVAKDQTIEELQNRIAILEQMSYQSEDLNDYSEETQNLDDYSENAEIQEFETEEYQPEESLEEYSETIEQINEENSNEESLIENNNEETQEEINTYSQSADGHYDDKGYYWFNDKTYYDANGLFHDLEGNVYDTEGNLQASGQEVEQELVAEQTEEQLPEEKLVKTEDNNLHKNVNDEQNNQEQVSEENNVSESADGHYDDKGYYWFNDKTYYDANGLFHDLEGNVYDAEGNLQASGQEVEQELVAEQTEEKLPEENLVETEDNNLHNNVNDEQNNEEQHSEENNVSESTDGHYDDNGYYWFNDKTYYDANGLFHDLEGNVYDAEGNLQASGQEVEQEQVSKQTEAQLPKENLTVIEDSNLVDNVSDNIIDSTDSDNISEEQKTEGNLESDQTQETTKRKAGRPKKEKSPEEENKPKRKVGRPKKESSLDEENKPRRKVGRPKKEKSPEEENKPKRKVGRPKKESSPDEENKPKRKVGRPKKESEPHIDILKQLGQSLLEVSNKQTTTSKKRSAKKN